MTVALAGHPTMTIAAVSSASLSFDCDGVDCMMAPLASSVILGHGV
jgi:hypothetical protein